MKNLKLISLLICLSVFKPFTENTQAEGDQTKARTSSDVETVQWSTDNDRITGTTITEMIRNISFDVTFQRVEIDSNPPKDPWIKIVGDLNGDEKPDIIVGGKSGPLVWYKNPDWTKTVIAEGGFASVEGAVGDIDNDGDLDIILGGTVWYENPGENGIDGRDQWPIHQIADYRGHDVQVADLNKDGKLDVVVRDQSGFGHNAGNKVIIFTQTSPTKWSRSEIECSHGEGLKIADLDRDGCADIIVGNKWYKNPGKLEEVEWGEYTISSQWTHQDTRVVVADFNNDGRPDVCLSPAEPKKGSYKIAWYAAPVNPLSAKDWKEYVIDSPVETVVHSLNAADMNNDGLMDIVAASMHPGQSPQEVRIYQNKRKSGKQWQKQVVSIRGSHETIAVDIDGDGAVDIIGANYGGAYQPLEWWRNLSSAR